MCLASRCSCTDREAQGPELARSRLVEGRLDELLSISSIDSLDMNSFVAGGPPGNERDCSGGHSQQAGNCRDGRLVRPSALSRLGDRDPQAIAVDPSHARVASFGLDLEVDVDPLSTGGDHVARLRLGSGQAVPSQDRQFLTMTAESRFTRLG